MEAGSYSGGSGVQPSPRHLLTVGEEDWAKGLGYRELPNLGGIPMFKDPFSVRALPVASLPLPPLPFPLPLVTSPWECQSARCRNLGEQHSLKTGFGWWPRQFSHSAPPWGAKGRVRRGSGLRDSLSRQVRPAQCRKLGRGWRGRGPDGWMLTHGDGRGRLFSRQVLYSQCNGFLHEGSLCLASQRSSGRS